MYLLIILAIVAVMVVIKRRQTSNKRSKNVSAKPVEYEVHVEFEKEIRSVLYQLDENGLIQREKAGSTYKLTAKNN